MFSIRQKLSMSEKRLRKLSYLRRSNGREFNKARLCVTQEMIMGQSGNKNREVQGT